MDGEGLTYAIGDIHGCADQLDRLLAEIEVHRAGRPRRIVCLGDYVDRGPDSARVIATLRALQEREPGQVTCLKGNHEAMLLGALSGADEPLWLFNGGRAVLASYGVARVDQLPRGDLDWIAALPTLHEDARRWYVHAGFRPGRPAPDPDPEQRLWIREPFLSADYDFGKHVVHGHTPLRSGHPDARRHRTNLDTGAVFGGPLTAGVFTREQAAAVTFLQVR
ncbi:metallophosphoesterase family protein [Methylobacterium sp. WSM2598]|uniref:metallophosphoesterase family protein n=1 Tax=Methylobacterium sp. WSM2598 TaxID=398261 RepID=UPI000382E08E|nr:metallophosphoesterase family protein [Methylobacterium sp. WSM2598]